MGRQPDGAEARAETIHVRLAPSGLAALDEARGAWTRSQYIRAAVEYAVKNGREGPARGPDPDWE